MPSPSDPTTSSPAQQAPDVTKAPPYAVVIETQTCAQESSARPDQGVKFGPPASAGELGTLGPYRVIRQLGHGGMGAVYLAIDTRLNRKLALKVMLPRFVADPAAKERFLREARSAAQVAHDNVVTVYEADERDGITYIAMQFLQGYPLDEYLRRKGTPAIPQILRLAREAAAGLAAAHRIGLVHRDIKPANLWLEAPKGRVKVLDFGLAKPLDDQVELTQSGVVIGTPAYMSPEQARGQKVDSRTDLFSLGAVLYQLCTGRLPFEGPSAMAVLMALATEEPRPVQELNPSVPAPLADLIHQLLAKNPDERPPTADELVRQLREITDALTLPTPLPPLDAPPNLALSVTAVPEPDPFRALQTIPRPNTSRSRAAASGRKKGWPWLAIAAATVILSASAFAVHIALREVAVGTNDGPAKVPTTSSPTQEIGEFAAAPQATKGDPSPTDPVAGSIVDPDRAAASWVLSVGGTVKVNGEVRVVAAQGDLPTGRFALTAANLADRPVSDADLANLKDVHAMSLLILTNTSVKGDGLAHLKDLTGLTQLWLKGTRLDDAMLVHLKDFKALRWLTLAATGITDPGLAHVAGCEQLEELGLDGTKVTDKGLVYLTGLKSLRQIWLNDTAVTDEGLAHLVGLKGLAHVNLRNTQVTAKGAADLRAAIPGCVVEWEAATPSTAGQPTAQSPLTAAWQDGFLTVRAAHLPGGELQMLYLEAFCRPGSSFQDWDAQTLIPHTTELVSTGEGGRVIRLRSRLLDGVLVDHVITVGDDEVDFRLTATNPTQADSMVEWASPCLSVESFTGTTTDDARELYPAYIRKCFVFIDGKLTRLPTMPWATEARYTPGQVYVPKGIDPSNVNPRPVSPIVPSSGLAGAFSHDERWIVATAWEPYQELVQSVLTCMHADIHIGGLKAGQSKTIRGKLYVVPADIGALVKRYERDFPEHKLDPG